MSRTGPRHAHRLPQSRGNGHGPRSEHRDQRCVLGGDLRGPRPGHRAGIGPCVTDWPVRRPGFPYTGGRTRHQQRCAAAVESAGLRRTVAHS